MEITENISPEYAEAFGLEETQAEDQEGAAAEGGEENQPEGSQTAAESADGSDGGSQEAIGAAIKNISATWPEIKSLEDIAAMPTSQEFNRLVQLGNSMEEAFYLANRKEIESRKIAAARTAAVHGVAGKQHLNPVPAGGGSEPVEVPADMRDAYLEMMPGATDAEIKAAYTKFLKDTKKG